MLSPNISKAATLLLVARRRISAGGVMSRDMFLTYQVSCSRSSSVADSARNHLNCKCCIRTSVIHRVKLNDEIDCTVVVVVVQ